MNVSLTLLSTDTEISNLDDCDHNHNHNHVLLVINSQTILKNKKIEKLVYKSKNVTKIFKNGTIEVCPYDQSNTVVGKKALLFNNYVILGCSDGNIRVYFAKTPLIYDTILFEKRYMDFYVDKFQLYVRESSYKTNIYDANIDLIHENAFGSDEIYFAVQHSYDVYCVFDMSTCLFHFKSGFDYYINDGIIINDFKYKNTDEKIKLSGLMYAFLKFNNGSTNCYIIVTYGNIYIIDSTFSTIIYHEILPFENYVSNVIYTGENSFDIYWKNHDITYNTHQYISHYRVDMNNIIPDKYVELTTKLKNQTVINSFNQIFHISENIPDTQIAFRICCGGIIYEKLFDGFSIKRKSLIVENSCVLIPDDYAVCILNDKIFISFANNIVCMFDIRTLRFIQKFTDVRHFNTDGTFIYFHMNSYMINRYKCDGENIVIDKYFNGFSHRTSIAIKNSQDDDCIYIILPKKEGILIRNNDSFFLITSLKYRNEEKIFGHLLTLFQITDDESNIYYLVANNNTIFVINSTFERIEYFQTFEFTIQQIFHIKGNCFDVYHSEKKSNSNDLKCTYVDHYKLIMADNDHIQTIRF